MKISELMHTNPVVAHEDDSLNAATQVLSQKHVRHLPVLNAKEKLVGIITDRDMKRASASDASLLEMHELLYLLSKIKLSQVMTRFPITATPGTTLQAAAGMMVNNRIGCLPVLEDGKLVGILTETDILSYVAQETPAREKSAKGKRAVA